MSITPHEDEGDFPTPEELEDLKKADKAIGASRKLNPRPKDGQKTFKERERESKVLTKFLSEYLDTFTVIGFNTSGQECIIMKYGSPLEERALTDLMDEFFTRHFESLTKNRQGNNQDEEDDDEDND